MTPHEQLKSKTEERKRLLRKIDIDIKRLSVLESDIDDLLFDKLNTDTVDKFKEKQNEAKKKS